MWFIGKGSATDARQGQNIEGGHRDPGSHDHLCRWEAAEAMGKAGLSACSWLLAGR